MPTNSEILAAYTRQFEDSIGHKPATHQQTTEYLLDICAEMAEPPSGIDWDIDDAYNSAVHTAQHFDLAVDDYIGAIIHIAYYGAKYKMAAQLEIDRLLSTFRALGPPVTAYAR